MSLRHVQDIMSSNKKKLVIEDNNNETTLAILRCTASKGGRYVRPDHTRRNVALDRATLYIQEMQLHRGGILEVGKLVILELSLTDGGSVQRREHGDGARARECACHDIVLTLDGLEPDVVLQDVVELPLDTRGRLVRALLCRED